MIPSLRAVRKFNPGTGQTDEDIIDQFVVRRSELQILLDVLRSNIDAACCQSTLVVAPRGAGKTMLLARTAAELRSNPDYSRHLLPVRLMEENHEAYDIGEFWLEAIFHLILEIESAQPEFARELRRSRDDLCGRWRPDLGPQAFGVLLDAADRLDRRLVLLVENLQNLCRDADNDFGWSLRAVLQNEPRIMLVASATTRFQELRKASEPFFELFRFVDLKPLDTTACLRLWRTVSGDGASERTIRPLEIFTGGSPRLLVIIAEFALHRSLPKLMEELVTLIDNHTEYFRGHLDQLPRGERRVYVAIIDLWQPSGTGEIAQRARMDVRATSTCIGRLVTRGLISTQGTGHRKRYVATERLYSIYYKLRRERDEATVVRNLIRFMVAFYTTDELMEMSDDIVHGASESGAIYQGLALALRDEPAFVGVFESGLLSPVAKDIEEGRYEDALDSCQRFLTGEPLPATTTCQVLIMKARCFNGTGDHRGGLAAYDEVIQRFGDQQNPVVQQYVVIAEFGRAAMLNQLGEHATAIDACDRMIRSLRQSDNAEDEEALAMALTIKATALHHDEQFTRAIKAFDEVIACLGDRDEKRLVAIALVRRGIAQRNTGDHESAIATWDDVIDRFSPDADDETRDLVAAAVVHKASTLVSVGSIAAAHAALDKVLVDLDGAEDPRLRRQLGRALATRAVIEVESDRPYDALETSERVEREFANVDGDALVWYARCCGARALLALGDLDKAYARLHAAYQVFEPRPLAIRDLVLLVSAALSAGTPARDLVDLLSNDEENAEMLTPLIVALRQECGEDVRAAEEILEVAADIRASWHEENPNTNPHAKVPS